MSWILCEHGTDMKVYCLCDADCICRFQGGCKNKELRGQNRTVQAAPTDRKRVMIAALVAGGFSKAEIEAVFGLEGNDNEG